MNMIYEADCFNSDDYALHETLFHNANGYIGVRSSFEEGCPEGMHTVRGSYINGFYDFVEMPQAEKLKGLADEKQIMLNVADTQGIHLFLEGELFSMFDGTVLSARRRLNMAEGYTERFVHWRSPGGKEVEIRVRRLASFTRPSLFLIVYSVKPLNFSGELRFVSSHRGDVKNYSNPDDPRMAAESPKRLVPVCAELEGNASYITLETLQSKLRVCTAVDHLLLRGDFLSGAAGNIAAELSDTGAVCTIYARAGKEETLSLCKYTIFKDSIRHGDCGAAARQELGEITKITPRCFFEEQREYLDAYWERTLLEIEGDDELDSALKYNLYQLAQSTGRDGYGNIAAKGLSGEGYEGHYFWDTEMYIEPFFSLTNPETARSLISYRYTTLDEARKNARLMGHEQGALFPWRTIMGRECSGFFPAGTAQYHINGDIAWSVILYYLATGDVDFIKQQGAELVFECARLWIDTGNYYEGQFRINDVTGPDEYTCIVNNNYYTNVLAQYNLAWAVTLYQLLERQSALEDLRRKIGITGDEVSAFAEAAIKMYLPYDEKRGINPQDDSFLSKKKWDLSRTPSDHFPLLLHYHPLYLYRYQVCKQADTVMAYFACEDAQIPETMRRSFEYYEEITTHDSSLSTCIFSIVASRLGFYEKAFRYFGNSAKLDLLNTKGNTKDGIHTANMGGTCMAILFGFAGIRIKEDGLYFAPHLPERWKTCRFRLMYRGSRIQAEIDSEELRLRLLSGDARTVSVYDAKYLLETSLKLPLRKDDFSRRMPYEAVIFDLDGVLVSTDRYHYQAWGTIARELGIPFDEKLNNRLRGVSRMESLEIILQAGNLRLDEERKKTTAEKKNTIYRGLLNELDNASVEEGALHVLERLKSRGIKLAVASSSKNARFILEKTGLAPYFDAVVDGAGIAKAKPDPEVFLKAAALLQAAPAGALVVEDSLAGIEAAKAGGFDSAALGDAKNSPWANHRIEGLTGLLDFFSAG